MRILLIEDDEWLGESVIRGLGEKSYLVDWLKSSESARHILQSESFDLLLLDLNIPQIPGLTVLRQMRSDNIDTPVIIITAKKAVSERVEGLDAGADDYVIKPFDIKELIARIRALLKRTAKRTTTIIYYKCITLDPASHAVTLNGEPISLPRSEFGLLHKMLSNQGHVIPREHLMQTIYGWNKNIDSNALEVHIHNLRKKLGAGIIQTIRGVGYMIEKEAQTKA